MIEKKSKKKNEYKSNGLKKTGINLGCFVLIIMLTLTGIRGYVVSNPDSVAVRAYKESSANKGNNKTSNDGKSEDSSKDESSKKEDSSKSESPKSTVKPATSGATTEPASSGAANNSNESNDSKASDNSNAVATGDNQGTVNPVQQPVVNPATAGGTEEITPKLKGTLKLKCKVRPGKVTLKWNAIINSVKTMVFCKKGNRKWESKPMKKLEYTPKLKTGVRYVFQIRSYSMNNKKVKKSNVLKVFIPGKAKIVSADRTSFKNISFNMSKDKNATSYVIYQMVDGNFSRVKQSKSNSISVNLLKYDKRYTFYVALKKKYGKKTFIGEPSKKKVMVKSLVNTKEALYSYNDLQADLSQMISAYPGRFTYESIGKSEDGREIYDVIIGNKSAYKTLLVVNTVHAREYMCSQLAMKQIEDYCQNPDTEINGRTYSEIKSGICIHMIVMANPDGVMISQQGIGVITSTKLRNQLFKISRNVSTSQWKANARGVDINRNFPYKFRKEGKPSYANYTGKKAATESEVKAIIKLTKSLKGTLQGVVNYHSMGNIIFGDCKSGFENEPKTTEMYNFARTETGYASADSYYSPSGGRGNYREYVMYVRNLPSITIEIGSVSCPLPASEFKPVWKANKRLVMGEANLFI